VVAARPWFATPDGRRRLAADQASLAEKYPQLTFVIDDERASITGIISVMIGKRHGIVRSAPIAIDFPPDYPRSEPIARFDLATFKRHPDKNPLDRHVFQDGRCCLELFSSWKPGDADALFRYVEQLVVFVHRQFIYDANGGNWPGPEWEHGIDGLAQFVEESVGPALIDAVIGTIGGDPPKRRSPCPCGSSKAYAQCDKRRVATLIRDLPSGKRRSVAHALDLRQSTRTEEGAPIGR